MRRPIPREHDEIARERRVEPPPLHPLLALQRGAGNAAVARFVESQRAAEKAQPTDGQPLAPYYAWTKEEVRPIQRELQRLRLYELGIDGILGKGSGEGLVEAFGGDEWRNLDAATALTRLTAAERPKSGRRATTSATASCSRTACSTSRSATASWRSSTRPQWAQYAQDIEDALTARGYTEDAKHAAELYAAAGRQTTGFGRFFVKDVALTYAPPAGPGARRSPRSSASS